jgi:hypothetical protein
MCNTGSFNIYSSGSFNMCNIGSFNMCNTGSFIMCNTVSFNMDNTGSFIMCSTGSFNIYSPLNPPYVSQIMKEVIILPQESIQIQVYIDHSETSAACDTKIANTRSIT